MGYYQTWAYGRKQCVSSYQSKVSKGYDSGFGTQTATAISLF